MHRSRWAGLAISLLLVVPPSGCSSRSAPRGGRAGDVRLVVLLVVDQLRGDYLTRLEPHFAAGGIRRLMAEGAHFANAYYDYSSTATGPGHATIVTGRPPRRHGIVGNAWYEAEGSGARRTSVSDESERIVGSGPGSDGAGASPRAIVGLTLGDQMKLADRRSREFAVSLKDRGAVLLGGKRCDGAYWWSSRDGQMRTSSYYGAALPAYLAAFNEERWADRFAGRTWERLLPEEAYAGCHVPDPRWYEGDAAFALRGLGAAFPHRLPEVRDRPGREYYEAVYGSPFGNEIVFEAAARIVEHEQLGRGAAPDMLCISLSANDVCGHMFGAESPEVMDMTLRTDRQVAEFLRLLERQVGLERCLIVLTADHGVTTAPELAVQYGAAAVRLDAGRLRDELNRHLQQVFGAGPEGSGWVQAVAIPSIYFSGGLRGVEAARRKEILIATAEYVRRQEGIAAAFTEEELSGAPPAEAEIERSLSYWSYCPGRSGEINIRLAPYCYLVDDELAGHSPGFSHDRHVPIMLYGPGVRAGRYWTPARVTDIAVTVAGLLGIEAPEDAAGRVLHEAMMN